MDWNDKLLKASFRGIPFAIIDVSSSHGRRNATHEYPYRDKAWVEDIGRKVRKIKLNGFLVGSSLLYKSSDIITQRDNLVAACEKMGVGTLVHPTFGELTVSVDDLTIKEGVSNGNTVEFSLSVTESGLRVFAITNIKEIESTVDNSYLSVIASVASSYISSVKMILMKSNQAIKTLVKTTGYWENSITSITDEASNLVNTVNDLFGNRKYGRYSSGDVGGHVNGVNGNVTNTDDTNDYNLLMKQKIISSILNKSKTANNLSSINGLNNAGDIDDYTKNICVGIQSILDSGLSKYDMLNAFEKLYWLQYVEYDVDNKNIIVLAMTNLYFKIIIAALFAKISAEYIPSSYDDAMSVLKRVILVLDDALLLVGNYSLDDVYIQLKQLKSDIINAVNVKGANLSHLTEVITYAPVPALTMANQLYQDANRADELIVSANPIHPAFMPTKFNALSE
ncbi:DNA circularization N-terminal domain-containing protein (plasmid) [Orbus sturtevantii]|uniref:DNA circularization protein n=1 Tax=Orbus sturtevantii TaxID=3074109 RepID=UPI00370D228C